MSKKASKHKSSGSTHEYSPNDVVLAKLRGFPPWPGMVVAEIDIPAYVSKERPHSKKGPGGSFCIRFFPVGDYSWLTAKEISLLQKHEIEAYVAEPHKKNGDLLEGYKIALDPTEWLAQKKVDAENLPSFDPENEVDELEDEEDADGEDASGKKIKGTKRKRESDAKSKAKKSTGTGDKPKRAAKKSAKGSDAVVESEEDSKPSAPKKAKKDIEDVDPEIKKVRDWRHALQRIFLSKIPPKDEDMPSHNKLFTEVENYDGMTITHLTETKIGKVMRHISLADDKQITRDDEFKFKSRAQTLVEKWQKIARDHEESTYANGANGVQSNGTADKSMLGGDLSLAAELNGLAVETSQPTGDGTTNDATDAMKVDAAPEA